MTFPPRKKCKIETCVKWRYGSLRYCHQHYLQTRREDKEQKKAKKLERKQRTKTFQKSEWKKWHTKCWKLMSEWVRRKDADWRGLVECFTCYAMFDWREVHAGHLFHGKLDFDERNLKPQCPQCNLFHSGRREAYVLRLARRESLEWVEKLSLDASGHPGYRLEELKVIYADIKAKVDAL